LEIWHLNTAVTADKFICFLSTRFSTNNYNISLINTKIYLTRSQFKTKHIFRSLLSHFMAFNNKHKAFYLTSVNVYRPRCIRRYLDSSTKEISTCLVTTGS
jgi:hypothetical protein